jgi:hypothetical protein
LLPGMITRTGGIADMIAESLITVHAGAAG